MKPHLRDGLGHVADGAGKGAGGYAGTNLVRTQYSLLTLG